MSGSNADTVILEAARRYGLITAEAAHVLLPDVELNAITKRLAGLTDELRLEKSAYIPPRCCWHLWRPRGKIALPRDAALLCFCLLGPVRWEIVERRQLVTICASGEQREAVFVDQGAKTPDHVARKVARYCDENDVTGLTGLTCLVPTEAKGIRVWRAAMKHSPSRAFRCIVVNDLREILANAPAKHAAR